MDQGFDVYCGLDVGKSEHHATAVNRAGERLFDKPLPQDEAALGELFTTLQQHGNLLLVVDQPNTVGAALPVAVARDCGGHVAYLPGLAMRKSADLYPGNSKQMPGTRSSSPRQPGRCRTRCGPWTGTARPSPR